MMLYVNFETYYENNFALIQYHGWNLEYIDELIPWERDVYLNYLSAYLEFKELQAKEAQQ